MEAPRAPRAPRRAQPTAAGAGPDERVRAYARWLAAAAMDAADAGGADGSVAGAESRWHRGVAEGHRRALRALAALHLLPPGEVAPLLRDADRDPERERERRR